MPLSRVLTVLGLLLLLTIPITAVHAAAPSYGGSGTAVISDAGALSDRITYTLSGVTRLEAGMTYEGWLIDSGSDDKVSTGVMTVLPDGSLNHTWTSPDGTNLLALYDTVTITVEPVPDDDPAPSDVVAFSHTLPAQLLGPVRELVVAAQDSDQGVVSSLQAQIEAAMNKLSEAQAADNVGDLRAAIQDAVDIIDAEDGIIALSMRTTELGTVVYDAAVDAIIREACECVRNSGENIQGWVTAAKEDAAAVLEEDDIATAKVLLNVVRGKLTASADGIVATDLGGAVDAYVFSQKMATFQLPAPADSAVTAPVVGDSYVPLAIQLMLVASIALLICGGGLLFRDARRRLRAGS